MSGAVPPPPAPAPCFDSHAHLTDEQFAADLPEVFSRAARANVAELLIPATEPAEARRAREIARMAEAARAAGAPSGAVSADAASVTSASAPAAPRVFWSAGLHPHSADRWEEDLAAELEAQLDAGAVAVGETGLDFHYENSPRKAQREAFAAQAALASARDLPLVVHSRAADRETLELLRESGLQPMRVILHCFSAGVELFEAALEEGYYVSFSGLITFKNYATPQFMGAVPAERLLVESDAPYLAPVPLRGRRNEPAFLPATLARVAEARGLEPAEAAVLTRANALRVYKLPDLP
jgi:TatD DNase family protein